MCFLGAEAGYMLHNHKKCALIRKNMIITDINTRICK
jgi:hypothetical protein